MDISSLLAMVHGQPNIHLLSTLSRDGGLLQGLIEKFRTIFNYQDSRIYSFYETDMSPTAQEGESGKWTMTGRPAVLVDRHSARSGRSWEGDHFHLPISRNHSEMVKFFEYSEDCGIVCDILKQFGEEARAVISRRWWFWEKQYATRIRFRNPIFRMLFADASALSPPSTSQLSLKPQIIDSGAQSRLSKGADIESDIRPSIPSAPNSQLRSSVTLVTKPNFVSLASDMRLDHCNTMGGFVASRRGVHTIGKQKIEIMTSGAATEEKYPPDWLTKLLTMSLNRLLTVSPNGFRSSSLDPLFYESIRNTKLQWFSLSSGVYNGIWLLQHVIPWSIYWSCCIVLASCFFDMSKVLKMLFDTILYHQG